MSVKTDTRLDSEPTSMTRVVMLLAMLWSKVLAGVDQLQATYNRLEREYEMFVAAAGDVARDVLPADYAEDVHRAEATLGTAGQVNGFLVMVIGGATLIVGFFVVATINGALPSIENNQLQSQKDTTVERIGQAMVLGGVVLIVIGVTMVLRTLRDV